MKPIVVAAVVLFAVPVLYVTTDRVVASIESSAFEAGVIEGRKLQAANMVTIEDAKTAAQMAFDQGEHQGHFRAVSDQIKRSGEEARRREEWEALLNR